MIIALDGPAGSGKSTTARRVADRLGYAYLDTGAMYRAVALAFLRADQDAERAAADTILPDLRVDLQPDEEGDLRVLLDGEDVSRAIRKEEVSEMASRVSALPEVREKLVAEQRRMARERAEAGGGTVLDGRDIGTVVFPDAEVKVFVECDAETRASRRVAQQRERGEEVDYDKVLEDLRERDRRDAARVVGPLKKAEDAVVLDTTGRTIEDQVDFVLDLVRTRDDA